MFASPARTEIIIRDDGQDPRQEHRERSDHDAFRILAAAIAAPKPLSMLHTVTPAAQLLSIASNADSPSKLAPYPTLVGTAITGTRTSPPTTDGSAPSIPATTITTAASRSASCCASRRW